MLETSWSRKLPKGRALSPDWEQKPKMSPGREWEEPVDLPHGEESSGDGWKQLRAWDNHIGKRNDSGDLFQRKQVARDRLIHGLNVELTQNQEYEC